MSTMGFREHCETARRTTVASMCINNKLVEEAVTNKLFPFRFLCIYLGHLMNGRGVTCIRGDSDTVKNYYNYNSTLEQHDSEPQNVNSKKKVKGEKKNILSNFPFKICLYF